MKKIICLLLTLCLIITVGCGGKKDDDTSSAISYSTYKGCIKIPDEVPKSFILAPTQNTTWSTKLTLNKDGTFTGEYRETLADQVENDTEYTLIYLCNFEGYFKDIKKVDEHTYTLTLGEYTMQYALGDEWVDGNVYYQSTEPFGIANSEEFGLYLPGKTTEGLKDNFLMWVNHKTLGGKLDTYALHNTAVGYGFVEADQK